MKILLPIDDTPCSTAAVDAVIAQFRPETTAVRLLHVVEWPKGTPLYIAMGEVKSAGTDLLASRDRVFRRGETVTAVAAGRLREHGFQTTADIVPGLARETILDVAAQSHPDLIVMGSHGWHGLDRWLLGSVSDAVVRQASCSVQVVRTPVATTAQQPAQQLNETGPARGAAQ